VECTGAEVGHREKQDLCEREGQLWGQVARRIKRRQHRLELLEANLIGQNGGSYGELRKLSTTLWVFCASTYMMKWKLMRKVTLKGSPGNFFCEQIYFYFH
jgi:hypothetical protein